MGWNCPACGYLLRREEKACQHGLGTYRCNYCTSRFLIVEGKQPRTYLNSVMICIDDGEDKKRG